MNAGIPAQAALARADYLCALREMTAALEAGDEALFEQRLAQLLRRREEGLFVNLARITRELHSTVHEMRFDSQLAQFAGTEMPDACLRLDYVVQLTENAAHRTLDLVDKSRVLARKVAAAGSDLADAREHAKRYVKSPLAVTTLVDDLKQVQDSIQSCASELSENLSQLSQTQEYQDLTGQVIKRVIKLVRDVESALLALLRATGASATVTPMTVPPGGLQGPAVPGAVAGSSQQDADALLASLGF
jgi:chemotaxis protein CheZ